MQNLFTIFLGLSSLWFVPLLLFIVLIGLWVAQGVNESIPQPVIAQYEPPQDFSVLLGGYMADGKITIANLHATLVDYYLKDKIGIIEETKDSPLKLKRILQSQTHFSDPWSVEEYAINTIFENREYIETSWLFKYANDPARYKNLEVRVKDKLIEMGYLHKNILPKIAIGITFFYGILALSMLEDILQGEYIFIAAFSFLLFILITKVMPKYTKKGRHMRAYLAGFKHYMEKVEEHKLKQANIQNAKDNLDKGIIAYAILFGMKVDQLNMFKKFLPSSLMIFALALEKET